MKNIACKNCGGTMYIDASGMTAVCPYCGSQYVLDHADTDYYNGFYRQMAQFLSGSPAQRERQLRADKLWKNAGSAVFECADGRTIEVRHLYNGTFSGGAFFVARKNIIYHFTQANAPQPEQFRKSISLLDYPSADTRQLSLSFPSITSGFALADGTSLLVLRKEAEEYPLSLFGTLGGRHVAWIISRMENICCVLEYNSLVHPAIDAENLYINPFTHQAALYGGWWRVVKNNTYSPAERQTFTTKANLLGLRNTAARLLGYPNAGAVPVTKDIPKALAEFVNSTPKSNAYDDFAYWDKMLFKAYGKRKFIRFSTDEEQIYGGNS